MLNRRGCKRPAWKGAPRFLLPMLLSAFVLEVVMIVPAPGGTSALAAADAPASMNASGFEAGARYGPPLVLDELVGEALRHNPALSSYRARVSAADHRIPQEKSLPDPMFSAGYQNEGWDRYSFGDRQMSMWNFAASQEFPYPGKLGLKGEVAREDAESMAASYEAMRLRIASQVKEVFYSLFLYYKDLDIIAERVSLFTQIENAALARYSSGLAPQEEVILAQTEKYTLLERKQKIDQRIQAADARLDALLGRQTASPPGRPAQTEYQLNVTKTGPLVAAAISNSPQVKSKQRLVEEARAAVKLAKKQYYPDFTVTGQVSRRAGDFMDIWSLTTAVNVPLYYRTKQREGVREARALLGGAEEDLEATRLSLSSEIENYFSIARSADKLMKLYSGGLIPKTSQDFEAALSGYITGKVPALTAIDRLKALLDYEFGYWEQFTEKQKALANIEAITGKTGWLGLKPNGGGPASR